jgi:hypothetical protein
MKGICAPVPTGGEDPEGRCRDQTAATCGNDGTCNGTGQCRKYAAGTLCGAASCSMGVHLAVSTCDGNGACQAGARRQCAPYTCNAAGTDCNAMCNDDSQCSTGTCDASGHCGKKKDGAMCEEGTHCESGFCVEGVCCATECKSLCKSCALADSLGKCTNVPSGNADPNGGCMATAEETCGNDGTCNGSGACRKWGTNTRCRGSICPAGSTTLTKPAFCDGKGACAPGETQSCEPYKCDGATNECLSTCDDPDDCTTGNCHNMSCGKKLLGKSCRGGGECDSGNCIDGTCCASDMCGTCQSCANDQGKCEDVPDGMPDGDSCSASGNACGTTGLCNGSGACRVAAPSTPCGQVCVDDDTAVATRTCDGAGMCGGPGPNHVFCGGFICKDGECEEACTEGTNAGCAPNKVCMGGTSCVDPPPP